MEKNVKTYECMFMLDAGNPDFQAASEPARTILQRNGAEILSFRPWDDRRLAYEILGRKRALYVLVYFKADPLKVAEVEHDCRLDERILRVLILRRDTLTEQEINAPTPATGGRSVSEFPGGEGEAPEQAGALSQPAPVSEAPEELEAAEQDKESAEPEIA